MQRSRPARTVSSAPAYRAFFQELLSFGLVGFVGTLIMIFGANLMRARLGGSPVTSVAVPTVASTLSSYLLNRYWTFRHRDSDGSGRFAIFFALNGVGLAIQILCTGFTYYTLGLHGGVAYNLGLLAGVVLSSAFRYWSYKKWVFTTAAA
ncbi:GtrA family protein [Actinomadura opuntiae]|uniref:GtrA family protein n=1 Tax=Actinomadura sp. OS1-43 TaxID=604315 RepID=UPI00255AD024|nr:GtrA family protein [Actinomadura sp. OS1-43]MDL4818014.1 GtrA family protein [Actinomadura sp. OS1-43]